MGAVAVECGGVMARSDGREAKLVVALGLEVGDEGSGPSWASTYFWASKV
jgi:hypothetical protein